MQKLIQFIFEFDKQIISKKYNNSGGCILCSTKQRGDPREEREDREDLVTSGGVGEDEAKST